MFLLNFAKKYRLVLLITFILFIIPFFWLHPGEMDLGGDSSRLYFYDPVAFIKSTSIFDISAQGKGVVEPNYYYLPYVGLLAVLKFFTHSSTIIISLFNGVKLAGGFIAIYLIVRELLLEARGVNNKKLIYAAAILSGIFYIVSLDSIHMDFFWERAIMSHNQVFLNPLIFFLLLKFLLTHKYKFLWVSLIVSFIFAPNFGLTSAPPFFAFYPLALLFLLSFVKIFGKKPIPWKGVGIGLALFLGVHAFHLLAQAISLFDSGSFTNSKVFSKEEIEAGGVNYFSAVSPHGKAILNLLLPSGKQFLQWASFISPLIVIVGFLLNKGRKKEFLFISLFFVITFFLATANITNIGFEFYRKLFYIPGFSMFRNFYTQWMYIFLFFYSLLFGFAAYNILLRLKPNYAKLFYFLVFILLIITGMPLFSGEPINKSTIRGSDNVKGLFTMDPVYEKALKFIRYLPDDGKILVLPLTDNFRQVIYGKDGGAYEGPSTILHLTNKYSFVGYQHFGYGKDNGNNLPYAEDIMRYSREKNYDKLLSIFTILNIRYVFHNSDPMVYEKGLYLSDYEYMQTSLPKTQDLYKDFLAHFPLHEIYKNGQYVIYEIDKSAYNPTIFIPEGIYESNQLSFDKEKTHAVFIEKKICEKQEFINICKGNYKAPKVNINFTMINPTLYAVTIRQKETVNDMLLVMQHTFNKGWKLVSDKKYIAENTHIPVNGYENGWVISGKDVPKNETYALFIKLDPQKYFWYGWSITGVCLALVIGLLIFSSVKDHEKN